MIPPLFVLTRFNIHHDATTAEGDAWLRARVDLFERFTLPSMRAQTAPPDRWLIYCHSLAGSPAWFRERAATWDIPWLEPVWLPTLDQAELTATVFERLPEGAEQVITTRLDNDDAVARDFCQQIRAAAGAEREFINFPSGAQYADGKLYRRADPSSPFLSFVEPAGPGLATVYIVGHDRASEAAPVRQVATHPMWMAVIHGRNLVQQVSGVRVPPGSVLQHFALDVPVRAGGVGLAADIAVTAGRIGLKSLSSPSRRARLRRIITRR